MESQPAALISVSLYVPAALYVLPFQVYGNWLAQMVAVCVPVTAWINIQSQGDDRVTTSCIY